MPSLGKALAIVLNLTGPAVFASFGLGPFNHDSGSTPVHGTYGGGPLPDTGLCGRDVVMVSQNGLGPPEDVCPWHGRSHTSRIRGRCLCQSVACWYAAATDSKVASLH
jgi:hypothetical protein